MSVRHDLQTDRAVRRGGLGDRIEYLALRAVMGAAGLLPPPLMGRAGDLAGDFVYHVLRTRRRVVEENLHATLGQTLDRAGVDRIARDVYRHLGRTLFEYGRFGGLRAGGLPEWLEVRGFEHLEAAHRRGRGVVVVTGHFGNWELLGAIIAHHRLPIHFLAKEQRNPYVDRYMDRARGRHLGVGVLNPGPELRRIFRCLRQGELIGMLFDQDAGSDGIFLDVLGRPASVQPGAAVFAYRTGATILPCGVFRLPGGRHRALFEPAFDPDPSAPYEGEIRRLTERCEASLERYIYLHPEQYYWVHRRWKTRPPADAAEVMKRS